MIVYVCAYVYVCGSSGNGGSGGSSGSGVCVDGECTPAADQLRDKIRVRTHAHIN